MICNVSRSLPNTLVPFAGDLERFTIAPEHDGSVQVGAVEEDVPLLQKADNLSMRMTVGIVLAKLRDRHPRIDRIHPFFLIGGAASVVPQLEDVGAQQAGIVGFEQGVFIWLLRVPGEKERGGPEVQPADNRGIVQALGFLNQRAMTAPPPRSYRERGSARVILRFLRSIASSRRS